MKKVGKLFYHILKMCRRLRQPQGAVLQHNCIHEKCIRIFVITHRSLLEMDNGVYESVHSGKYDFLMVPFACTISKIKLIRNTSHVYKTEVKLAYRKLVQEHVHCI